MKLILSVLLFVLSSGYAFAGQWSVTTISSVSYLFHMNDNNGTSIFNSRGTVNGVMVNSPIWVNGKYGYALSFNAGSPNAYITPTTQKVDLPFGNVSSTFLVLATFPIPNGIPSKQMFLHGNKAASLAARDYYVSSEGGRVATAYGSGDVHVYEMRVPTNVWVGIGFRYDGVRNVDTAFLVYGSTVQYFSRSVGPINTVFASDNTAIGGNSRDGGDCRCTIDEAMIVNRAMSDGEVISLLKNAVNAKHVFQSGN